jgi:hypothetical protein
MSDCGVCIGGYDYDGAPEFHAVKLPKARKPHACCECKRGIPSGSVYEKTSGKYDGEFYSNRTCLVCAEIRDAFSCDGGVLIGELWQEMHEYGFEKINESCFAKLQTVKAKRYLRGRWMKWKGIAI